MAWTTISNALVAVGALPFATTIQALRDNPIAIANGDTGAPRIQTAAIQDSAVTTAKIANANVTAAKLATGSNEVSWVAARNIAMGLGGVGSYAMLSTTVIATLNPGDTQAGGNLRYTNAAGGINGTPAGTWRIHGATNSTSGAGSVSTFLRIA